MSVFSRSTFSAKSYAAFRPSYPASLYNKILTLTGHNGSGSNGTPKAKPGSTLLDLGCGHGIAAASLSPHFSKTYALDPSAGMIAQAKSQHEDKGIEFHIGGAEDLSFIPSDSVDLVVSAQAAHWFNYKLLWPELNRIVKKDGAIAFWGYKDNVVLGHPAVNDIFDRFIYGEGEVAPGVLGLGPFWEQPGRNILRRLYRDIQPPTNEWDVLLRAEHEPGEDFVSKGDDNIEGWMLRKTMNLGALDSYHRTFSSYKNWKDETEKDEDRQGARDVFDVMWEHALDAEPAWREKGDGWKDAEAETDWGTCLLVARKK